MTSLIARSVTRFAGEMLGSLRIRTDCDAESFVAEIWDISIQGIGLLTETALLSGTVLILEGGSLWSPVKGLTATARHATKLANGRWLIGCAFSRLLTVDDFKFLPDQTAQQVESFSGHALKA